MRPLFHDHTYLNAITSLKDVRIDEQGYFVGFSFLELSMSRPLEGTINADDDYPNNDSSDRMTPREMIYVLQNLGEWI